MSSLSTTIKNCLRSFGSKFCIFLKYLLQILILYFDEDNSNEVALNVGLFIFYPTILWILLSKALVGFCNRNDYKTEEEWDDKINLIDISIV